MPNSEIYVATSFTNAPKDVILEPSTKKFGGAPEALASHSETEFKKRGELIVNTSVEAAKDICDPTDASFTSLQTHLENREKGFVDPTTHAVDTTKVESYVKDVYGKDTSGKTLVERIDDAVLDKEIVEKLATATPAGDLTTKKALLRASILHALATGSPREVNQLLKSIEKGNISFKTTKGSVSTSGKLLLNSLKALENNEFAKASTPPVQVKFKLTALADAYVTAPKDPAKKTAFVASLPPTPYKVSGTPANAPKSGEWTVSTSGKKKSPAEKMYKGLLSKTGPLQKVSSGMRKAIGDELSSFNKGPVDALGGQLKQIAEVSKIARDTTKPQNKKLEDIEKRLNERTTKKALGELFETVDINLSIENPRHKEVLARRSLEELKQIAIAKGVNLTTTVTPWNTTWDNELTKATTELVDNNNVLASADALARVAIFGPADLRAKAKEQLELVLTSVLLTQGENAKDLVKLLGEKDPSTYGTELKNYLTTAGTTNPNNSSVQLATLIFNKLENVAYFKKIKETPVASRTPLEQEQLDILINRLHNNNASVFDVNRDVDPATYSQRDQEVQGDSLQEKLQEQAIAEALGLPESDPKVQEILRLTNPGNILQSESRNFAKINQSANIRRAGLAGIAATGVALTLMPGTAPIGTAILAVTGVVKGAIAIKNIVDSSRRIGFKKTMAGMWDGFKKSATFLLDKERTGREKLLWGASFLAGAGRMFLPGIGSAIYAVAEAGAAVASERDITSKRNKVALEVAALRTLRHNSNYKTTAGRTVKVPDIWKEYKTRREVAMNQARTEALTRGETNPPVSPYSDREVFEYMKTNKIGVGPDVNKEADFVEVMEELIKRQEAVKEVNERYNRAAGMWGAAFAGSMIGNIFGGALRVGDHFLSNDQPVPETEAVVAKEAKMTEPQAATSEGTFFDKSQSTPIIKQATEVPPVENVTTPEIDTTVVPTPVELPTGPELPNTIEFEQFPLMKEGLVARGMTPNASQLFIDPNSAANGWMSLQRQAVELLQQQGVNLNSQQAGYAIGELTANAVYNGSPINTDALQAALAEAATRGLGN